VELFERGYGKDPSSIANDAVSYAKKNNFEVVLVDTAGRRHNDARLMSGLERFVSTVKLDKVFQVAEALVGTDSLSQARHFNDALGPKRNLDGFIISKVDTVGDLVGTIVSMIYVTGVPVIFVGVGQMYTDLRGLSVSWVLQMLMQ
jgi:signal recognition particle receptor subunit alpha